MPSETSSTAKADPRFERAATGRAKCRACDQRIDKGEWRVGDVAPNPFTEGTTTYWFHARCAALRRPELYVAATTPEAPETAEALERWQQDHPDEASACRRLADSGQMQPRLGRLTRVELAPSGRARCRHCRELIEKGALRIVLHLFQDGRFEPMGFLHVRCTTPYLSGPLDPDRLKALLETLASDHHAQFERQLQAPAPPTHA